jgi:hypothetical protein
MSDDEILAALEANGKAFLESFSLPALGKKRLREEAAPHSSMRHAKKKKRGEIPQCTWVSDMIQQCGTESIRISFSRY